MISDGGQPNPVFAVCQDRHTAMSVQKTSTRRYELRKRADTMAATRRRITEAAVELHGSVGPARTTITAIAERAGVQRQTVYRHFPSEDDLFAACSQHFYEGDPWPDPDRWRAIADPAERLTTALDELYAYYERNESMWTNVLRDETLVASVASALTEFWANLDAAADALAAGWGARGGRRGVLVAATRHAVDFRTWRSLARDGGVSRVAVVELASAMVSRASGR
jgi:AcrR family transcriptional regulator